MSLWTVYPLLAGLIGVVVMNLLLREDKIMHLPELPTSSHVSAVHFIAAPAHPYP